jgi:hypothetical protein
MEKFFQDTHATKFVWVEHVLGVWDVRLHYGRILGKTINVKIRWLQQAQWEKEMYAHSSKVKSWWFLQEALTPNVLCYYMV